MDTWAIDTHYQEVEIMKGLQVINENNFELFSKSIEAGLESFIPMLAFVKNSCHDFNRYKKYNPQTVYLIDYVGEDHCLYHLYSLKGDEKTLRTTLILPSSWDRRFEIIEKSLPNVKAWFLQQDQYRDFLIQVLEYGEIEYYPTLSYYIVPTIVKNGFEPQYKMYMKNDGGDHSLEKPELPLGYSYDKFNSQMLGELLSFYYDQGHGEYVIDYTKEELMELSKDDFFQASLTLIRDNGGSIRGAVMGARDDYWNDGTRVWMGNFAVSKGEHEERLAYCLLSKQLSVYSNLSPQGDIIAYLDRKYQKVFRIYEKFGFVPFEFWIDAKLKK